jgi:hypothetical protein
MSMGGQRQQDPVENRHEDMLAALQQVQDAV